MEKTIHDRLDELEQSMAEIDRKLSDIEKSFGENEIVEVKGKDKKGHLIFGDKKPMEKVK